MAAALLFAFASLLAAAPRWTELNIGPFSVDTDGDTASARQWLDEMEQTRWVLSGYLDDQNLTPPWPVRVVASGSFPDTPKWQIEPGLRGQYVLVIKPGALFPVADLAGLLLDTNTARLPADVESGLRQLFATLKAHGSRVTLGGNPSHPDLAFARMALFATKYEYSASFHIFLSSLKNGSSVQAAEANAFGRPSEELEKEAAALLAADHWQPVAVSGRPLDPKRDLGEHNLPPAVATVYQADAESVSAPDRAAEYYRAAVNAGPPAATLAFEGLAQLAKQKNEDPTEWIDKAVTSGSHSAAVYLAAAKDANPSAAAPFLKQAVAFNPRWAAPLVRQAELTSNAAQRVDLLKHAAQLNRRQPAIWIALAQAQVANGQTGPAQGSWIAAENAAATDAERDQIRNRHSETETKRLASLEDARTAAEDAAIRADRQAQRAQAARVREAVKAANSSLDAASQSARPEAAVPWNQVTPQKKVEGSVTRVDCLGSDARLQIRTQTGQSLPLLWRNTSELGLSCGDQKPPRRVSVTYSADPDDSSRTEGAISALRLWPTP